MSSPFDDEHMEAAELFSQKSGSPSDSYGEWKDEIRQSTEFEDEVQELIALAVASAIQCKYCVHSHGQKALKHGASEKQVSQAIQIAAQVKAGATMSYGLEALEHSEKDSS
ncbi:MAG: carboxymuconolactone decarboxylase family protein [Candidatus Aenigmatarchaeota archaeon]